MFFICFILFEIFLFLPSSFHTHTQQNTHIHTHSFHLFHGDNFQFPYSAFITNKLNWYKFTYVLGIVFICTSLCLNSSLNRKIFGSWCFECGFGSHLFVCPYFLWDEKKKIMEKREGENRKSAKVNYNYQCTLFFSFFFFVIQFAFDAFGSHYHSFYNSLSLSSFIFFYYIYYISCRLPLFYYILCFIRVNIIEITRHF